MIVHGHMETQQGHMQEHIEKNFLELLASSGFLPA